MLQSKQRINFLSHLRIPFCQSTDVEQQPHPWNRGSVEMTGGFPCHIGFRLHKNPVDFRVAGIGQMTLDGAHFKYEVLIG